MKINQTNSLIWNTSLRPEIQEILGNICTNSNQMKERERNGGKKEKKKRIRNNLNMVH